MTPTGRIIIIQTRAHQSTSDTCRWPRQAVPGNLLDSLGAAGGESGGVHMLCCSSLKHHCLTRGPPHTVHHLPARACTASHHATSKDDTFDRLAPDLAGMTPETASTNGRGKCQLAKAQAMVQSLACAVTANVGDPAAKQLANSSMLWKTPIWRTKRAVFGMACFDLHTAAQRALTMLLSLRWRVRSSVNCLAGALLLGGPECFQQSHFYYVARLLLFCNSRLAA